MTERFSAEWLAMREPFDHAARSVALARRFADALPRRPRVLDLGAGTGSMFRFLAPIIGRGQDWTLLDADGELLDDAFGRTAAWARRRGYAASAQADELLVSTPQGLWRMRTVVHLAREAEERGACLSRFRGKTYDGLVCSALLDLTSAPWLSWFCATLAVPLLACLSVDGRDTWLPRHPYDRLVGSAFRRDMRRDKGFGAALGTDAPRLLTTSNLVAASTPADWHIPSRALGMQRALIDGTAAAARNANPSQACKIEQWQRARLRQALRGRLAIHIGHRDILAFPPGG